MRRKLLILWLLLFSASVFAQNIDSRQLRFSSSETNGHDDRFLRFASDSYDEMVLGIPITIGIVGLIKHDEKWINSACQIVVANAINYGATKSLKSGFNTSFPSGHTSSTFATATSLSLAFPKWYVIAPSYLWAGTVGYSRVELGAHTRGDVFGGIIIGAGSAYLTYKLNKWINKSRTKKHIQR
jgi:hypothetical protein